MEVSNRCGFDVDVADNEKSSNDVTMSVGVNDEQGRQHDGCVAGSVLTPDITDPGV